MVSKKKLVRIIIAVPLILSLVLGVCWYLVTFRFKEALQFIVASESNGAYELKAHSIRFSFLDKTVKVKEAHLAPKETQDDLVKYDVKIPAIFFSITSWSNILLEGKVVVDSFSIDFPEISIHENEKREKSRITVHASDVFETLQMVKSKLSVRSFTLNNAAFSYSNNSLPGKFHSDQINFSVKDFSDADSNARFLTSEHVVLDIRDQNWQLPDNRHQIRFRQLLLSGEEKIFRIDSCSFSGLDKYDRAFSVSIDRVLFSTESLSALYQKDQLIIDSLLLSNPRVTIPTTEKNNYHTKDTGHIISSTIKEMLTSVQVKYIHIDSGMVFLANKEGSRPLSNNMTDVKIYNLIVSDDDKPIKTDSIILSQKKIAFTTKDNKFKLHIDRFLLKNNDLLLSNVLFSPTPDNTDPGVLTFKTPVMTLKNIDLEDLLEKKISAETAELIGPEFSFVNRDSKNILKSTDVEKENKLSRFYTVLGSLDELLNVRSFRIRNGNVIYRAFGNAATYAKLDDINVRIDLNEFAASDRLVEVKRSIKSFDTRKILFYSPSVVAEINSFSVDGDQMKTRVESFAVQARGKQNMEITGSALEWKQLNWDALLKGGVNMKSLHVKNLQLDITKGDTVKDKPSQALPINIGYLKIDSVRFHHTTSTFVSFRGTDFTIQKLRTEGRDFYWSDFTAGIDSFRFGDTKNTGFAGRARLHTGGESVIENIFLHHASGRQVADIEIPFMRIRLPLHSTVMDKLDCRLLQLEKPVISLHRQEGDAGSDRAFSLPAMALDKVTVNDARLHYTRDARKIAVEATMNMDITGLSGDSAKFMVKSSELGLKDLVFRSDRVALDLPVLASGIRNIVWQVSERSALAEDISCNWSGGLLSASFKDSASLKIEQIEGTVSNGSFNSAEPASMNSVLDKVLFSTGLVRYEGKKIGAQTTSTQWQPDRRKLVIGPFNIKPPLDEAAYFEKTGLQTEYVTVSGRAVEAMQLNYGIAGSGSVTAENLVAEDVLITTFRDKRLPMPPNVFKPMFGQMLEKIGIPVAVDTARVTNLRVLADVLSAVTGKRASIPVDSIHAEVTGLRNFGNSTDSLRITGGLKLYNTTAHRIVYKEAHNDSLYSFSMQLTASPMHLPELTDITMPFGNVMVESGDADTLYARWNGNKYAAVGKMNFYYDGLKVKLVKSTDSTKTGLFRRVLSLFANDVLIHKKNHKPSYIFYIRDTRKTVFNYWVKSLLSGALSSSVIFQEKKLKKRYDKHKKTMQLPEMEW